MTPPERSLTVSRLQRSTMSTASMLVAIRASCWLTFVLARPTASSNPRKASTKAPVRATYSAASASVIAFGLLSQLQHLFRQPLACVVDEGFPLAPAGRSLPPMMAGNWQSRACHVTGTLNVLRRPRRHQFFWMRRVGLQCPPFRLTPDRHHALGVPGC